MSVQNTTQRPIINDAATVNRHSPQAKNLIAWYPCTQRTGSFVYERARRGANGTVLRTSYQWKHDKERRHSVLSLTGSCVAGDLSTVYCDSVYAVTFCCWLKRGTLAVPVSNEVAFSKYINQSIGGWQLGIDSNPNFYITLDSTTITGPAISDLKWHHVAGVYQDPSSGVDSSSSTLTLYVDGSYVSTVFALDPRIGSSRILMIGGINSSISNTSLSTQLTKFTGSVYDCRVYNRALNAAEIRAIAHPDTRYELWEQPVIHALSFTTSGNSYNETASGGVVCGGTALRGRMLFNTATGGAVAAGVGTNYLYDIAVGTAGAKVGGRALKSWYNVASGGALVGGTATGGSVPQIFNVTASGGAVLGTTTKPTVKYTLSTGGGVKAAGYGYRSWYYTSDTGVKVGGPQLLYVVYKIPPISGGMTVAGTCRNYIFDFHISKMAAVCGGSAAKNVLYRTVVLSTSGARVGGAVGAGAFHDWDFTAAGSVVLSSSTLTGPDFPYTGEGATVVTSGAGDTEITEKIYAGHYSDPATSVVYVSGIVEEGVDFHHHISTGAIVISGATETDQIYNDRVCQPKAFGCVNPFPSPYKDCYTSRYYNPVRNRAIPKSLKGRGAFLPNITVCQQKPYLPIPDVAPKT
jgi:hypothetical protein